MRLINIMDYLDATVAKHPDKIAARDAERELDFASLQNLALSLAGRISNALQGKNRQIIATILPKGLKAVIADLAILYSGNAYMNLDRHNPEARLAAIIENTRPALQLGSPELQFASLPVMDFELDDLPELDAASKKTLCNLRKQLIDTDLLCLINTSGSTGTPKAVALCHRGFLDFTEAVAETGLVKKNEIIGSLSPVVFDIWSFELCMVMAFGATLVCLPEHEAAFPARLLQRMAENSVSFIFWVPTIMVVIANQRLLDAVSLPSLRMIWFAGEVFPTVKFNYWVSRLPQARFANFYGPIEITLDCLYYVAERPLSDTEPIPIGKPFPNTRVLLLDACDREISQANLEDEGEICVVGSSLAAGYYNDPEKTALAFVQNPLQNACPEIMYRTGDMGRWNQYGELMFAGRKDTLVKHHGYRIELAEIEHMALTAKTGITNCCALYDGEQIILAYEAPEKLNDKYLLASLRRIMPKYMVPQAYWHHTEMPRNPNGKIDRNFLKVEWENISRVK